MRMKRNLQDVAQAALDAAKAAGADAADVFVDDGTSVSVDVRQGQLEQAERAEGIDIGLRLMLGQRQAVVSASDVSVATLRTMAERGVAMAHEAPDDPFIGLARPDQLASAWDSDALELADPADEPSAADLQSDAQETEASALENAGISQVQSASATYGEHDIFLATSNGFSAGYKRTGRSVSCVAIAGTGLEMERDYDGDSRIFQSDLRSPSEIGHRAATRAVERQGARKPPTGSFPVLYDERISSSLIGHLLGAANGSAIARGSSWLRDRLGEKVLPDGLDLIEDPTRRRVSGSRPFDAEGLATSARKIIDNGVLTGWTLDLANARKLEMHSTANATRSVSSAPMPGVSNVTLTAGAASRDDLIRDMGTGLLVTSMIGSTINANTGDYSRGAAGFWVENGEIAYPVNECTIAGNLHDMLGAMIPANDGRAWLSRVVPSLLIEGMTLAGS